MKKSNIVFIPVLYIAIAWVLMYFYPKTVRHPFLWSLFIIIILIFALLVIEEYYDEADFTDIAATVIICWGTALVSGIALQYYGNPLSSLAFIVQGILLALLITIVARGKDEVKVVIEE